MAYYLLRKKKLLLKNQYPRLGNPLPRMYNQKTFAEKDQNSLQYLPYVLLQKFCYNLKLNLHHNLSSYRINNYKILFYPTLSH